MRPDGADVRYTPCVGRQQGARLGENLTTSVDGPRSPDSHLTLD